MDLLDEIAGPIDPAKLQADLDLLEASKLETPKLLSVGDRVEVIARKGRYSSSSYQIGDTGQVIGFHDPQDGSAVVPVVQLESGPFPFQECNLRRIDQLVTTIPVTTQDGPLEVGDWIVATKNTRSYKVGYLGQVKEVRSDRNGKQFPRVEFVGCEGALISPPPSDYQRTTPPPDPLPESREQSSPKQGAQFPDPGSRVPATEQPPSLTTPTPQGLQRREQSSPKQGAQFPDPGSRVPGIYEESDDLLSLLTAKVESLQGSEPLQERWLCEELDGNRQRYRLRWRENGRLHSREIKPQEVQAYRERIYAGNLLTHAEALIRLLNSKP